MHDRVRRAAASGAIIDAYTLADELIADDLSYAIDRREAADLILAACVVYGASLVLDPGHHASARRDANAHRPLDAAGPLVRRRDPGPAVAEL